MKVLIVLSHQRENSLTYQTKTQFEKGLKENGAHQVDTLDLFKMKFNPVLYEMDEPDWPAKEQNYPEEIVREQQRLLEYDAIVFVFPLYWWGMPAMLKGYIERVWSFGFAYGSRSKINMEKCLWLSLAGAAKDKFETFKYDEMLDLYFNIGIAESTGIKKSKVKLLHKSLFNTDEGYDNILNEAYQEGLQFTKW